MGSEKKSIRLVGHPYAPIGMGEHVRCTYRALRTVAMQPTMTDIYKLQAPDYDDQLEFASALDDKPAAINIFHINGDEVEQSLAHLGAGNRLGGYNIIYPAWELSRYPDVWAALLDRFDEIWAQSIFTKDALEGVCSKPVILLPEPCEVVLSSVLSRRYFGIPEADYTFLFFFDIRSYATRKNPYAVIQAFRSLLKRRPYAKVRLVLKINGADVRPEVFSQLQKELADIGHYITIIHRLMTDNEAKNLVRCCDCFVSLHRTEGFGRGAAEAMALGKPVAATSYSGNMTFMNHEVSCLVKYDLIPVNDGEYPHWEGQVWADADVNDAANYMIKLVDDPQLGYELGRKAALHMKKFFSYNAIGLSYQRRLEMIAEKMQ